MTQRPLSGCILGISISESEDMRKHGFRPDEINSITLELCRRFVALGASVVLGHQWRPNGVMDSVTRFARAYIGEADRQDPIIQNFLAWPDRAALSEIDRKDLESKALVRIHEQQEPSTTRPGALLAMRRDMAKLTHARLCLAGKLAQPGPEYASGVLEEAALCCERNKPVFFTSMLGGMSATMVQVSEQRLRRPPADHVPLPPVGNEVTQNYLRMVTDVTRHIHLTNLDVEKLRALWHAENLDTIVHVVASGLAHFYRSSRLELRD
jgi:hypothetical protein